MSISVEARVWIATHLLFPNSTQAFDVYQAIVSQSDRAIQKADLKNLLLKLSQICEKIPPVNSSLSFHAFENKQLSEWKVIYKKTQRIQQLIFIGVLIFELNLEEISTVFKMTFDKTRFLFHQTFKKVVQVNAETNLPYDFKFKKSDDRKVSYLYTNENLIDFSLGNLNSKEIENVKVGLQNFPNLQMSAQLYAETIKQIKDLLINHESFAIIVPPKKVETNIKPKRKISSSFGSVSRYKKPISISTISLILLAIVFIRPRWIENLSDNSKNEALVLLELKKTQTQVDADEEKSQISLNELPIQSAEKSKQVAFTTKEDKKAAAAAPAIEKPLPKPVAVIEPKKQGGLYRGILYVTDLEEVSPKLIDKIVGLGGKKAGEVELGWKKTDKLGYYHFTLPQDNVAAVNEYLAMFGKYKFDYENHPRLVPAGLKRFIIEVKESD
jgi:hypothetical protein